MGGHLVVSMSEGIFYLDATRAALLTVTIIDPEPAVPFADLTLEWELRGRYGEIRQRGEPGYRMFRPPNPIGRITPVKARFDRRGIARARFHATGFDVRDALSRGVAHGDLTAIARSSGRAVYRSCATPISTVGRDEEQAARARGHGR